MRMRAILAAVALAALMACGGSSDEAQTGLESATVERTDLVSSVAATGTVEPIRVIDVKSQASGEILEVAVELGDRVEQGDLLVRIDPRDVQNAYDQAEADLQVAQARMQVAERQLERVQSLHDSAIVTDEELEGAILENADAQANLVKARTNLQLARERLNDVVVRAPIRGIVVEKNVEDGQIVTSTREVTGGTTLVRMADLSEVQVRTLVDETDVGSITAELPATIRVEAYPDREFRGRVLMVEPQAVVEQNVTMFAVLVRIQNEEDLLRPGMNADVEMVTGRQDDVLALVNGAVKAEDEARQLAEALGLELPEPAAEEPAPGQAGAETPPSPTPEADGQSTESGTAQAAPAQATPAQDGEGGQELRERLRNMSAEERRRYFESLTPAERRELMQRAGSAREQEVTAARRNPGRHRPGYVFQRDGEGRLVLHPVTIGLSTWERTEIVSGLAEGDQVVIVPQSLIQQREMLDRVRKRSGIPGVQRQ
ncbi:MAG: efflux RND transporter periplasmic adaptor subunit [Gemmatimonadota bacterium]